MERVRHLLTRIGRLEADPGGEVPLGDDAESVIEAVVDPEEKLEKAP